MFVRRSLIVLALTLAVVRCTDQPTALQRSPHVPQFVRWAANVAPQFTAISPQSNQHGRPGFRTPPLSLDTYSVSFWAVRGESRSVQINYSSAIDTLTHPFMQLTVTDPTFAPGQGDIAVGDSVLVTVNIDTTKIGLTLEPTGLQFGERAQLRIWYGGALGDLNGDGVVDSVDQLLRQQIALWYHADKVYWVPLSSVNDPTLPSVSTVLYHFSEYAVSY